MKMKPFFLVTALCAGMAAVSSAQPPTMNLGKSSGGNIPVRGTVAEFYPYDRVVITSRVDPLPVRYAMTRETVFVDERGVPVRADRIRRGAPVTVEYARDHDRMLASRVVVQRAPAPAPISKAEAKALREYYERLSHRLPDRAERAEARAQREYYDKLEDSLRD